MAGNRKGHLFSSTQGRQSKSAYLGKEGEGIDTVLCPKRHTVYISEMAMKILGTSGRTVMEDDNLVGM